MIIIFHPLQYPSCMLTPFGLILLSSIEAMQIDVQDVAQAIKQMEISEVFYLKHRGELLHLYNDTLLFGKFQETVGNIALAIKEF
jgi:hypothetical protein